MNPKDFTRIVRDRGDPIEAALAEQRDAAIAAKEKAEAEASEWRKAIEGIIRELDDEDGCMGIDVEPLDIGETSADDVISAVSKRNTFLMGWVRRYIMGEQVRGDATREEENARARVQTLMVDRDNAIQSRDEWKARAEKAEGERDAAVNKENKSKAQVEQLRAALSEALSVANDCQQRWSRGHPARIERATIVLDSVGGAVYPTDAAERSRDELGIQLAAQGERLRLAMAVVEAARHLTDMMDRVLGPRDLGGSRVTVEDALAALDAVPGDALKQVGTLGGTPVYVDQNLPEHDPLTAVSGDALATSSKVEAYTVEQIRAAFARACLDAGTPFFARWPEIANAVVAALATSTATAKDGKGGAA